MADFEQKYDLDLRFGGSTLGDFGFFYDNELPYIYKCLNSLRRNQATPPGENVEPAPHQFKVEDEKLYIRNTDNQEWIFLMDLAYKGGLIEQGDSFLTVNKNLPQEGASKAERADKLVKYNSTGDIPSVLTESDKAGNTTETMADKLAVYNNAGILPANISGSPARIAGKLVNLSTAEDGQVISFDVATQSWIPVDRLSGVGQGKTLALRDYKGYLGTYNGGAMTDIELPVARLMPGVTYAYGEIAQTTQLPAGMVLVCVSSGSTPSEIPTFEAGDEP